jgi:hypothetical protein
VHLRTHTSNIQPHPAAVTSFTSAMHKTKRPSFTLQPLSAHPASGVSAVTSVASSVVLQS